MYHFDPTGGSIHQIREPCPQCTGCLGKLSRNVAIGVGQWCLHHHHHGSGWLSGHRACGSETSGEMLSSDGCYSMPKRVDRWSLHGKEEWEIFDCQRWTTLCWYVRSVKYHEITLDTTLTWRQLINNKTEKNSLWTWRWVFEEVFGTAGKDGPLAIYWRGETFPQLCMEWLVAANTKATHCQESYGQGPTHGVL